MRTRLFAGLPTRPIFYAATGIFVVLVAYHYLTTYRDCTTHAALREALHEAIGESDEGGGEPLRLASLTDFEWDRAEILVDYQPPGRTADCPFGWDWSRDERAALVDRGLLTVIVFLREGKVVSYLESRRDWVEFVELRNPYTPQTAAFEVRRSPRDRFAFILTPRL